MSAAEEREVRELDVLVQLKKFRLGFAWKEAPESEAEPDEEYERHAAALENVESLIAILGKRARIRASRVRPSRSNHAHVSPFPRRSRPHLPRITRWKILIFSEKHSFD